MCMQTVMWITGYNGIRVGDSSNPGPEELDHCKRTMPFLAFLGAISSVGGDFEAVGEAKHELKFISWNAQKRPAGRARHVFQSVRKRYGADTVCALQEIPRLGLLSQYGLALRTTLSCDVGL